MAVQATKGATISLESPVLNFDKLTREEAIDLIYNTIVPLCEKNGIKLSQYGNHTAKGSLSSVDVYEIKKKKNELFDVTKIQKIFASLDELVKPASGFNAYSYGLIFIAQKRFSNHSLIEGDLIVAMLFKGYKARFGNKTGDLTIHCEFNAQIIRTNNKDK